MSSNRPSFLYGYAAVLSALVHRPSKTLEHVFLRRSSPSESHKEATEFKRKCDVIRFLLHNTVKLRHLSFSYESLTTLTQISRSIEHDGFVLQCAVAAPRICFDEKWCHSVLRNFEKSQLPSTFLFPVGLRNPVNLGMLAKTCEFLGASMILPSRRSVGLTPSAHFESGGALDRIEIIHSMETPKDTLQMLKKNGFQVVVTSLRTDGASFGNNGTLKGPTVIVMGSERYGLPEEIESLGTHQLMFLSPHKTSADRQRQRFAVESLNINTAAALSIVSIQRVRSNILNRGFFRLRAK